MEIIEYSRRLQDLHPDVKIIYITELNNSVFEVFHSTPTYILSRPLNIGHVKKALEKALHELSLSKEKNFTIINKQGIYTIPYTKIYYVESDKRKLNIYGEEGLVKTINLKISDFLKYEHGVYFLQCHKSYAVNLMHISQLEKYENRSRKWNEASNQPIQIHGYEVTVHGLSGERIKETAVRAEIARAAVSFPAKLS